MLGLAGCLLGLASLAGAGEAPATVLTPPGGTYYKPIVATATAAAPGNPYTVRYTLDGSAPQRSSLAFPTAGLPIDLPITLKAATFHAGAAHQPSATVTAAYAFAVAPLVADLPGGIYTGARSVALITETPDATIRYTLDGTAPTTSAALTYAGPIELPGSVTLRAVAERTGWTSSPEYRATYRLRVPTPTSEPAGGTFYEPLVVTAAVTDANAELRYTTDGTTPVATSSLWPAAGLAVEQTTQIRWRAFRAGWLTSATRTVTYTLRVSPVTADLPGGTYIGERSVALATATPGAAIRYTLDGSVPTADSPLYAGPIALPGSTTLRAIASRDGWRNSATMRVSYTLRPAPVVASLPAGTYDGPQTVALSSPTPGAVIRYTLDGLSPTGDTAVTYVGPIELPGSRTLRAVATLPGWRNSTTLRVAYTLRLLPPAPTPPAGTYAAWPLITAVAPDADAVVRYTLGTATPRSSSPIIPASGLQLTGSTTLNLISTRAGWANSPPVSAIYALDAPPVAQPLLLSGDEDTVLVGQAQAVDTDSATLTWALAEPPANGTAEVTLSGLVTYTPDADWNGADSFIITVSDDLSTVPVTVSVTVLPVDDPTVITVPAAISAQAMGDVLIPGLAVADIDTPELTVSLSADVGSVVLPGGATSVTGDAASVAGVLAQAIYRAPDEAGSAAITVVANGVTATIAVTIAPPPVPATVLPLAASAWDASTGFAPRLLPRPGRLYRLEVQTAGDYFLWVSGRADHQVVCDVAIDDSDVGRIGWAAGAPSAWGVVGGGGRDLARLLSLQPGVHTLLIDGSQPFVVDQLIMVARTPAPSTTADHPVMVGPGAVAILDAAAYDETAEMSGFAWLPEPDGSVRLLPNVNTGDEGIHPARGLSYNIHVTQDGIYQVWGFGAAGSGPADDSVWIAVDGAAPQSNITWSGNPTLRWSNSRNEGGAVDITLTAGAHRLDVRWREDGVRLRQLAISGMPGWKAYGLVHPTSERQGVAAPDAGGAVVIEAEAPAQLVQGQDYTNWSVQSGVDGSVGDILRLLPDIGRGVSDVAKLVSVPAAVWYARFDAAGTYDVWVRGAGPNYAGDSVILNLAQTPGPLAGVLLTGVGPSLPLAWSQRRNDGTPATIEVPAPGIYPVMMWMREDGAAVDRILLQPTGAAAPTGAGPAASPLVSPQSNNG